MYNICKFHVQYYTSKCFNKLYIISYNIYHNCTVLHSIVPCCTTCVSTVQCVIFQFDLLLYAIFCNIVRYCVQYYSNRCNGTLPPGTLTAAHARRSTRARTHALTHAHARTLDRALACSRARARKHARKQARSLLHSLARAHGKLLPTSSG